MPSIHDTLTQFGLNDSDVRIFVSLIEHGEQNLDALLKNTPLSRTTIYDSIENLKHYELVTYRKEGRNVYYNPAHPEELKRLIHKKNQENQLLLENMESSIRELTNTYALAHGKPGIAYYSGESGITQVLRDSLSATEGIFTYVNEDIVEEYVAEIDEMYEAERIARCIPKKIILVDTPSARAYHNEKKDKYTETKLLPTHAVPFESAMEIYDDTISFLSVSPNQEMLAFLITHSEIAKLQQSVFMILWDQLS